MIRPTSLNPAGSTIPPGPRGYPLLGVLPMLLRNPLHFLSSSASQYGGIFTLSAGPQRLYLLNHPDHFKHVLQDRYRNYHKGVNTATLKMLLGEGLVTSEGDFWLRQRRLAQPAFHHQRLANMATMMIDATEELLQRWQATATHNQSLNLVTEMKLLTQQIIVTTMFSSAIGGKAETVCRALNEALTHIGRSLWMSMLPARLIPGYRQFQRAIDTLNDVVYGIIEDRRRSGDDPGDLLTMLLQAQDADTGEGMSDRQVRDEVMTMFIGGHETTATTLAWTWHLLAQHPEVEQRLLAELATVLGGRTPAFHDLPRLTYTKMVIEEVLRLYPVVWATFRTPLTDDMIGDYVIPAGSIVMLSPYLMHRSPSFWDQPDRFDPDRFTPDRSAARPRYTYIPFSAGPRQCIGSAFAMMEAQLIVATIAQRYRLQSAPGHIVEPQVTSTLHPRQGVYMTLHPRQP